MPDPIPASDRPSFETSVPSLGEGQAYWVPVIQIRKLGLVGFVLLVFFKS